MDPKKLWAVTRTAVEHALAKVNPAEIVGVGITSHRESGVMWDRKTGEPVHDVVVWISQQTDDIIRRWDEEKLGPVFTERTGLRNDSFFSAGKVVWLLENVPGLRAHAEAGEIALGLFVHAARLVAGAADHRPRFAPGTTLVPLPLPNGS